MTKTRLAILMAGSAALALGTSLMMSSAAVAQTAQATSADPAHKDASADTTPNASDLASSPADTEEIMVTARRRTERLIDVPVAVTVVSGNTLNKYQVTTLSDVSTLVPSLIVGKAASGSSASIFLRGVGSTALSAGFDQSVSFVIDNVPMSRGREISLPQYDVQSVEVLKGPQVLFFGKNATGGLISVTSNNPTATLQAGVTAGYGFNAQDKYVDGFVSGPVSDTIRLRLAGRYSNSEGMFTNTAADSYTNYIPGQYRTRYEDHRGGAETWGIRGTADWDVTPNFSLQLKGSASSVQDGGSTDLIERVCGSGRTTPLPANGLPPSPNADCFVNGRSDQSALPIQVAQANYRQARDGAMYGDFTSQMGILTAHLTSDPFDVTSITGYYHFNQQDLNNVSGEAYPASFSQYADFDQFSEELRFQSKFEGPFNLMFGAFYSNGNFVFNNDAYIFPVPLDPVTGTYVTFKRNTGFTQNSMSFYAEGTYDFTSQLQLAVGARYSVESRDSYAYSLPASSFFAGAFPPGIVLNDRYSDNNLSPEVTFRYKPQEDTMWYAAYKSGFKGGGFNLSQSLTPAASVANGQFKAETVSGGEAGLRKLAFNRTLSFNLTLYYYNYSDLQVQFFDPQTLSQVAGNAGNLRTQGVEADFNYRLPTVDGLSFHGALTYNNAKFHNYIGQCYPGQTISEGCNLVPVGGKFNGQDYENRTPPKAPKFAGTIGTTFETEVSSSGTGLRVSADLGYTSQYNYSDALRPDAIQPAFFKLNAAIALTTPNKAWTVSLIGRNLTNSLVVTAANDIPFAGGTGTGTAGPGVTADMSAFIDNGQEVMLQLSWKY